MTLCQLWCLECLTVTWESLCLNISDASTIRSSKQLKIQSQPIRTGTLAQLISPPDFLEVSLYGCFQFFHHPLHVMHCHYLLLGVSATYMHAYMIIEKYQLQL